MRRALLAIAALLLAFAAPARADRRELYLEVGAVLPAGPRWWTRRTGSRPTPRSRLVEVAPVFQLEALAALNLFTRIQMLPVGQTFLGGRPARQEFRFAGRATALLEWRIGDNLVASVRHRCHAHLQQSAAVGDRRSNLRGVGLVAPR